MPLDSATASAVPPVSASQRAVLRHKPHTTCPFPATCLDIPAGTPASRRRRSSSEERQPRQPPAEISLLLERSRRGPAGQGVALESLQVLTSDSIRDVQLRLRNLTAWFRPEQHALVRHCAGPGGTEMSPHVNLMLSASICDGHAVSGRSAFPSACPASISPQLQILELTLYSPVVTLLQPCMSGGLLESSGCGSCRRQLQATSSLHTLRLSCPSLLDHTYLAMPPAWPPSCMFSQCCRALRPCCLPDHPNGLQPSAC